MIGTVAIPPLIAFGRGNHIATVDTKPYVENLAMPVYCVLGYDSVGFASPMLQAHLLALFGVVVVFDAPVFFLIS